MITCDSFVCIIQKTLGRAKESIYMFDNVFKALKKIFSNEESYNKFSELKEWDDVYNECVRANPECSELEFYRFLLCLFEIITGEKIRIPISDTDIIPVESIEDVSGGANWRNRLAAATLAATSAFAGISGNYVGAKTLSEIRESRKLRETSTEKTDGKDASNGFLGKIKSGLKKVGSTLWDNKGKILLSALGVVLAAAGVKYAYDQFNLRYKVATKTGQEKTDAQEDLKNYSFIGSVVKGAGADTPTGRTIATIGSTIGVVGGLWTAGLNLIDTIGKIGDSFKKTGDGIDKVKDMVKKSKEAMAEAADMLEQEPYNKTTSYEQMLENLERVKGQDNAKRLVKSFFHRVVSDRERSEFTGRKNTAKVVVFNGPSGCGKSMTAGILARALTNKPIYTMSASEVDPKSGQTLAQQLFAKNSWSWDDSGSSFSSYIKKHPTDGVVIINEYDKMFKANGNNPHELDEVLRTWIDEGTSNLYGKEYDCSGITFILTTNESESSLKGEVRADAYGNLYDPSRENDDTKSLTSVVHDKSFLNRLTVVGFDNLDAEEYTKIAEQNFEDTLEFLSSEYGEYTDVLIEDESYKKMGKCLANINEGARPVEKFIAELFVDIVNAKNAIREQGKNVEGLIFKADFDYTGKDFNFNVTLIDDNDDAQTEPENEKVIVETNSDNSEKITKENLKI